MKAFFVIVLTHWFFIKSIDVRFASPPPDNSNLKGPTSDKLNFAGVTSDVWWADDKLVYKISG